MEDLLSRREVIYCGACGMPPEYCEYGPDFESHCDPWLRKKHPELHAELSEKRGAIAKKDTATEKEGEKPPRPSQPWSTEQRLTAFYKKYVPEKVDSVPALLEKYAGKEDKLFQALVQKYGEEPKDPYFSDSDDEEEDAPVAGRSKRRGASAQKEAVTSTRVVIQSIAQKRKRHITIVQGMETVMKLKDASKAFSKRFAGSSSVKDNAKGEKEIIIQGDHMYEVAEFIVDKFGVNESDVFLDVDGEIVPLR